MRIINSFHVFKSKAKSSAVGTVLAVLLSACAPTILGRTPQPAPVGETKVSLNGGYPLFLTDLPTGFCNRPSPEPEDDPLFFDVCYNLLTPYYLPQASPVNVTVARGVSSTTEISGTFGLGGPLFRVGGKTLLLDGPFKLAADYGTWVTLIASAGLDAGLLASYPLAGVEPYAAVRGFGTAYWRSLNEPSLTGAATVGARIPSGEGAFFLELTLVTASFRGEPEGTIQPTGFSLVPALGYAF